LKVLMPIKFIPYCLLTIFLSISLISSASIAQEPDEEDTYSISLVQTADTHQEIQQVNGKKVLTEKIQAKEGDYIWKILRDKGLLEKSNLAELLAVLKTLNSSLENLDLIHPGEEIVIPLLIAPAEGMPAQAENIPPKVISVEEAKALDTRNYTIKRGDSIIKVIQQRYNIPDKELYNEYIDLLKELNPSISDLDKVNPGQQVRIPIYSPQVVRMAIEPEPSANTPENEAEKTKFQDIGAQLGQIIKLLDEDWVNSGKHFIPLKSGGQINLSAESYPIIDLANGNRIIVDLYNDLPDKMSKLITSNWDNYKIINLNKNDNLKSALDKILNQCDYQEIYPSGKPLVLGGDIPLRITSDWTIKKQDKGPAGISIVNIYDDKDVRIPQNIKTFLRDLDINIIEHPQIEKSEEGTSIKADIITVENNFSSIVETLLDLTGQDFSKNVEIPIFQSQNQDFKLMVKADFLFQAGGRDCIIDLKGLGTDIINLLREHQFRVIPISDDNGAAVTVSNILEFLNAEYNSSPHPFSVLDAGTEKNIQLMITGISFNDINGQSIFATTLSLPPAITDFLSGKNYKILQLPQS